MRGCLTLRYAIFILASGSKSSRNFLSTAMKTVTSPQPTKLQTLATTLQAALTPPLPIRCGYKEGRLLVLAEQARKADQAIVFAQLQTAIESLQSTVFAAVDATDALPVRMFLRLKGQQPYAMQEFSLALAGAIVPATSAIVPTKAAAPLALVEDDLEPMSDRHWRDDKLPVGVWGLGVLVAVTAFGGSLWAMTRPCVLGNCVPLTQAERLTETASQTIATTTSAQAVIDAYDQLTKASDLLETIPPWSGRHDEAQGQLQIVRSQAGELQQIVSALHLANAAALKSQNPPHPFRTWQEIRADWQQAIARIQQVPPDSPVAALAQRKLTEYQANLATINRRIDLERQAQAQLNNARSTARIAEAREGVANSVDSWQLVQGTWESVVSALQKVPATTMAQTEAQQLLSVYQPKLAAARDRATRETASTRFYNDALTAANQAESAERNRAWSQAVEAWQSALTNAQQVPPNSIYHDRAQPLLAAYGTALARSREMLKTARAQEAAADDLDRTCNGSPKICDYSFADQAIRVRITPTYDRLVEQTMTQTRMSGDYATQAELLSHVNSLLRALAAISENANLPIELYNSDGSLFGTYKPEFSGYVPR